MKQYRHSPHLVEAKFYDGTPDSRQAIVEWAPGYAMNGLFLTAVVGWLGASVEVLPNKWVVKHTYSGDVPELCEVVDDTDFRAEYEEATDLDTLESTREHDLDLFIAAGRVGHASFIYRTGYEHAWQRLILHVRSLQDGISMASADVGLHKALLTELWNTDGVQREASPELTEAIKELL